MYLVVDLDDSLVQTDLLYESLFTALKRRPWLAFSVAAWAWQGRAHLKAQLAAHVAPDVESLPYRQSVLDLIRSAKAQGRKVMLASASHEAWVKAVAEHLGVFDDVIGSNGTNLKGAQKLAAIRERLGDQPFSYIGDSYSDLPIWASAKEVIAINPSSSLERRLQASGQSVQVIRDRPSKLKTWRKALRVHQWAKNALLFVPIIAGHRFFDVDLWMNSLQAFFAFSLLASSVYILNDLMDLDSDRRHQTKRNRPFSAGALSVQSGIVMLPFLAAAAWGLAWTLPVEFSWVLALYLAVNLLYTFRLKKLLMIDVVCLAALYTVRILAGGEATGIPVSSWLLACSTFFFFGLALVKRYTELLRVNGNKKAHGRGYAGSDREVVMALGVASSLLAVVVLALYLNSENVLKLYARPDRLWLIAPLLLYWVSRLWILTHRGQVNDDPVIFALKDSETWLTLVLFMAVMVYAL